VREPRRSWPPPVRSDAGRSVHWDRPVGHPPPGRTDPPAQV